MKKGSGLLYAGGICAVLALLTRLVPVGYGTTALCLAGLAVCLAFFGLMRRRGTRGAAVLSAAAGILIVTAVGLFLWEDIPVFADARSDEDTAADYGIVFGAAVHGTEPSLALTERLDAALAWHEVHPGAKLVVSGGRGGGEAVAEGVLMREWLVARGVSPEQVLTEPEAENSWQNLRNSLSVIEADGGDITGRVALISSEYHMRRLCAMARLCGCEPVRVAARTTHPSLMVNYAVREGLAMWKLRLFGP